MTEHQPGMFRRLRWRLFRNSMRQTLAGSKVRLFTISLSTALVWVAAFVISFLGFLFVAEKNIPGTGEIIGIMFDLAFFALFGMLTFSTGLIVYASLFSSPEAKFLLTTPARTDHIFGSKFQTACGFSSWAFVTLGSPLLVAYGIVFEAPWYFYAVLPLFMFGFIVLPGAIGSGIALLLVNFAPHRRKQLFVCLILAVIGLIIFWMYRTIIKARDGIADRDALKDFMDQFSLATSSFAPGHWMSRGLLATARGDFLASLFPLALLWINALFFYLIAAWFAKRLYRRGFDRLSSQGDSAIRKRATWPDRLMNALVFYLDPQTRLLIVKDFRTFRRDPAQWVGVVILAGLMVLYGFNTGRFYDQDLSGFQSGISLLNLIATSFLICAYLVRFIYPLMSLEGRKFWILGLLPLPRERLLWGKFFFAMTATLLAGCFLILLGDLLLVVPATAIGFHLATMIVLSIGLSGLSVGIGAWMPNFRETDPSKIVVGFGGTMNTIVSVFFLGLVILTMAGPYHLYMAQTTLGLGRTGEMPWWVFAGLPVGVGFGVLGVLVPMRLGSRTLRTMEF